MPKSKALFLLGAHRSGISVVAGALRLCGYQQRSATIEWTPDGPDLASAPRALVEFNDRVIDALGARSDELPAWNQWPGVTPADLALWSTASFGEAARRLWPCCFTAAQPKILCEDPRLSITLPIWSATAEAFGRSVAHAFVYRAPEQTVASLVRRRGHDVARASGSIADYWTRAIANLPTGTPVVDLATFVEAPVAGLEALGEAPPTAVERAALERLVDPARAAQDRTGLLQRGQLPRPLVVLAELIEACRGTGLTQECRSRVAAVARQIHDQKNLAGSIVFLGRPHVSRAPAVRPRKVVLHCHIFKNAGTSVDAILKRNFESAWAEAEFETHPVQSNADIVRSYLVARDDLEALSSHTADWRLGGVDDPLQVLPIVFLRHPLLRIGSAYRFERRQEADTMGARLAKEHSMRDYVRLRLDRPNDLSFRNFQSIRLARYVARTIGHVETAARAALDAAPFVGIVEEFAASVDRLEAWLRPHFPSFSGFSTHQNSSGAETGDPAAELAAMRAELGAEVYDRLVEANACDLAIYKVAVDRFASHRRMPFAS